MGSIRYLAFAATLLASTASHAVDYTLVDLGTLGGPGSYATAVANDGTVVGCSDVLPSGSHAFAWRDGVMRDLGTATGTAGGSSCALAVNDRGVIAGRAADGTLVRWQGTAVSPLGLVGTVGGINNDGVIVGTAANGTTGQAFLWREGQVTLFGDPQDSAATAINGKGQVAGRTAGRAFLMTDGALRDLGTLGGNGSSALDVNDHGEVVGMAANEYGQPTSFDYRDAMVALPAPSYSSAVSINDSGLVVGSAEGTFGYLVDGDAVTRLDALPAVASMGWRRLEPKSINDRGWIVGTATNAQGDLRAFLLVPSSGPRPKPLRVR